MICLVGTSFSCVFHCLQRWNLTYYSFFWIQLWARCDLHSFPLLIFVRVKLIFLNFQKGFSFKIAFLTSQSCLFCVMQLINTAAYFPRFLAHKKSFTFIRILFPFSLLFLLCSILIPVSPVSP